MSSYEPSFFVEPLGYQPVEFLDIPPMSESRMLRAAVEPEAQDPLPDTVWFIPRHRDRDRVDRRGVGIDAVRAALDVPIPVYRK